MSLSGARMLRAMVCSLAGALACASVGLVSDFRFVFADNGDGVNAHDFDGDGADDFALEYELMPDDSEHSSVWFLDGAARLLTWWDSGPGGWDRDLSHPVSGDFDGDGSAEVAAFYDYPSMGVQVLFAFQDGGSFPKFVWHSGEAGPLGATQTRVLSGDFNGDGFDDVMAFGDLLFGDTHAMWVPGSATGLGQARFVWTSRFGGWDLSSTTLAVGDIEGDGDDEVLMLYQYEYGVVRLWAMPGTPAGPAAPLEQWNSCQDCWSLAPTQMAAGDLDGDGIDDLSLFYDYGDSTTGWWVFFGDDLADGGFPTPWRIWLSDTAAFDSSRAKYSSGDFDGDGRDEVRALYGYGGFMTKIWSFDLAPSGAGDSVVIDVAAPPLSVPGVAAWGVGVALTAFYWDRTTLL